MPGQSPRLIETLLGFQQLLPFLIRSLPAKMRISIQLNNQFCIGAVKVHDKFANDVLPSEFIAVEAPVPETWPENFFRGRGVFSERTGVVF